MRLHLDRGFSLILYLAGSATISIRKKEIYRQKLFFFINLLRGSTSVAPIIFVFEKDLFTNIIKKMIS